MFIIEDHEVGCGLVLIWAYIVMIRKVILFPIIS